MARCSEGGCDDLKETNKAVFGEHRDGLTYQIDKKQDKTCMNKYIKKPPGWAIVLIITFIIAPTYGTGWKVWFGQSISQYLYASSARVDQVEKKADKNDKEIGIMKEQIHRIDETTGQTRVEVESINKKIDKQNYKINEQFEKQYQQFKMLIESIKK